MKYIKKLLFVLVLLFAFVLVGCGGEGEKNPDKPTPGPDKGGKTVEVVKTEVMKILTDYSLAEHGKFVLTTKVGEKSSSIEMTYNYSSDEIISQSTILKDEKGELSCYITENKAYINRYDAAKTVVDVKSSEGADIVEKYNFDAFCIYPVTMLNASFFDACEIKENKDGKVTLELNIGMYDVSMEEESDVLTHIYDAIQEKASVKLEVVYTEANVSQIIIILNNGTADEIIQLQLLGCGEEEIEIAFPDFTGYTK